jgi:hypothetical protein
VGFFQVKAEKRAEELRREDEAFGNFIEQQLREARVLLLWCQAPLSALTALCHCVLTLSMCTASFVFEIL